MSDSLFDNPKSATRPAKPPGWVVDELVRLHGILRSTAEKYRAGQAFAVLYRCRERRDPALKAANRRRDLAGRLTAGAADEEAVSADLHDLLTEAFANLDAPELAELCRVTAALLLPSGA